MNKDSFQKNKGLAAAFMAMALQPDKYDGKTPKAHYGNHRKKTKKGAEHKVGESFIPRYVTTIMLNGGRKAHVTPSAYRRFHVKKETKIPVIKSPKPRGRNVMSQEARELLGLRGG